MSHSLIIRNMKPMQVVIQQNTGDIFNKINLKEAESIIQPVPMPSQNYPCYTWLNSFKCFLMNHFTSGTN